MMCWGHEFGHLGGPLGGHNPLLGGVVRVSGGGGKGRGDQGDDGEMEGGKERGGKRIGGEKEAK